MGVRQKSDHIFYYKKKNQITFPFRYLFRAFDVTKDGIWLGIFNEDLIIDRFDLNGKFKQRFIRKHEEEKIYLHDFIVKNVGENNCEFWVLNSELYAKIDVLNASIKK